MVQIMGHSRFDVCCCNGLWIDQNIQPWFMVGNTVGTGVFSIFLVENERCQTRVAPMGWA